MPESLIDVVEPFVRVIVELGCDRSIPRWDPTARLVPMHDPVTAGDLIDAIGKGDQQRPGHHRPVNTSNGSTRSSAWTPGVDRHFK